MNDYDPIVGNWYKNLESQCDFVIVASDEATQTLEIQYADGQLEELDMESWPELVLEAIEPPEDAAGAFDELNPEDLGYNCSDTGVNNTDWNPARRIDQLLGTDREDDR